jgi:hypothetical protein
MKSCKNCGRYNINDHQHGRNKGVDLHLCDTCYWRSRYDKIKKGMLEIKEVAEKSAQNIKFMQIAQPARQILNIIKFYSHD